MKALYVNSNNQPLPNLAQQEPRTPVGRRKRLPHVSAFACQPMERYHEPRNPPLSVRRARKPAVLANFASTRMLFAFDEFSK